MKITIPFKCPSVNHLYARRGFKSFLTKEAKELKNKIHEIVEEVKKEEDIKRKLGNYQGDDYKTWTKDSKFRVIFEIHENWLTQKGEIKRVDVSNREKFTTDSIFDKLNIDDKQIFELTMRKIQDYGEEKSVVTILELK